MQPKEKSFNISLLRTLSTIIIVVFHVTFALSPGEGKTYFPLYIGVPVFLFISGFLYANKKIDSVKKFYKNIDPNPRFFDYHYESFQNEQQKRRTL